MTPTPENKTVPRVAIVIVSQDQAASLRACLGSLGNQPLVIVVDNGADDTAGFEDKFPAVRLIRLPRNFGQTKALNLGIRAADAELVLLLSPEMQISDDSIQMLADTLDQQGTVGAVCPRLVRVNGEVVSQIGELPSPVQPDPAMHPATPGASPACARADAIMLRSFFLRALRHIDERYGDFGSAQEICQQVKRANKTILIHPVAIAVLSEQVRPRTTSQVADREVGIARYLGKHFGFFRGAGYWLGRVAAALFGLRFRELMYLLSLKKIDGN